ncbi:MAG: transcription termination factor NusA [Firmicutes bacterium]|nr:transcription termination factor NusA [Bacillota bacterium]
MSGINLKSKEFIEGMRVFEDDRKISADFILDVLKEAIIKTYQKHIDAPAAVVRVEIDSKEMKIYHDLTVVDNDSDKYDETLDILYDDAVLLNKNAKVGDIISKEVDFNEIGRSSISVAKNMLKQKVKEYEKQRVYDEYKDRVYDLINGVIKTVEDKFILVDLKNTIGIMLKSEQIPGEVYRENQQIRAVIKEVSKNSRGSQVALSRADAMFVKRLFEKEVPEIAQGVVEIRAIAREAGERTKMAVYTKNEDIDPIGSCIGPRGTRVQAVIQEIKGEKIDIFEWNDDIGELVKNALSPAEVKACFYAEENYEGLTEEEIEKKKHRNNRPMIVMVGDDQLSAAIGKKGKNAKLAVKLTDRKIDIKTVSDIEAMGIDVASKVREFHEDQIRIAKEKEMKKFMALQEEALKRKAEFDAELEKSGDIFEDALDEMEVNGGEEEITIVDIVDEEALQHEEPVIQETSEEPVSEVDAEDNADVVETIAQEPVSDKSEVKEKKAETPKVVKTREKKTEYVSKFEDLANVSKREEEPKVQKKRRKKGEEEERRLRANDLKRDKDYEIKPEYTDEELEEIELNEEAENENSWINDEIDFDEFDDYYDKD